MPRVDFTQKEIGWVRLALSDAMKAAAGPGRLPGQATAGDFKSVLKKLEQHRQRTMRIGK